MAIANPGGMNATAPSILTLEFIGVAFGQVESFSTVLWKEKTGIGLQGVTR
jgi:hypothetical protein